MTEQYVTLFDVRYLPMGVALHTSLMQHAKPFHLWIVCIDESVERQLITLDLPNVSLIPLRDVETTELLAVKRGRTRAEYCWTLTPFAPSFVFERSRNINRITYLDADLYFLDSPKDIFDEFVSSGKQVLITEHAYAPEYDQTQTSGRFCVQFMVFNKTPNGIRVLKSWQDQCIEWCFNRFENGKFGDQKYLDEWPIIFGNETHIFSENNRTLAPWNVDFFENNCGYLNPIFYHFHSLKIIGKNKIQLCSGYKIGGLGKLIYDNYLCQLRLAIEKIENSGYKIKVSTNIKNLIKIFFCLNKKSMLIANVKNKS